VDKCRGIICRITLTVAIVAIAVSIFFIIYSANSEKASEGNEYFSEYEIGMQARNLHRLAKVWGFVIHTHQTFLLGERCWDEELLALIPIVRFAVEEDVNDILYNWFVGLGDDGYDLNYSAMRSILLEGFPNHRDTIDVFFDDISNHNWLSVERLHKELWLESTGFEINLRPMADLSWINESYLGLPLATTLSRFNKIQVVDRTLAPVYFDMMGNSIFTNKERFIEIDYTNTSYRILGLFRLWNTMAYFFPYLDIIDYGWSELLLEYIPKMLRAGDRFSYEVTLVTLAAKLQDAHIHFFRGETMAGLTITAEIMSSLFGPYYAPISLQEAEGHLVVSDITYGYGIELRRGDVILRVNDREIDDITTDMLQYMPYPNADKALAYLVRGHAVLRQHSDDEPMAIDVYRFGEHIRVYVPTVFEGYRYIWSRPASVPHVILENNIGLINPARIRIEEVYRNSALREIMQYFESEDVSGLIIDLRQAPSGINYLLAEYLLKEQRNFIIGSRPLGLVPGMFLDSFRAYSGYGTLLSWAQASRESGLVLNLEESFGSFFHNRNTVLLMNELTQSQGEFTVMSLRSGDNVTVMGTNSIGANGNVAYLPLPGEITMMFTGLGVYTPEGGQTQRIGLSPDIYVPRTITGIRDGRDELMDAAIYFLLEQMP